MKKTILLMLPFALGLAACSGGSPLNKGDIITPKFMERNFRDAMTPEYDEVNVELDKIVEVGEYTLSGYVSSSHKDWLAFEDAEGKTAIFSQSLGKFITDFDNYDMIYVDYVDIGLYDDIAFLELSKYDDESGETWTHRVIDELGNEPFAPVTLEDGHYIEVTGRSFDLWERSGNEYFVAFLASYDEYLADPQYAVYNIDGSISRKGAYSEYVEQAGEAASLGYSNLMTEYGHPELAMVYSMSTYGFRASFYNVQEHKFVSSFEVPAGAVGFMAGDYYVYQELNVLEERATEYDLFADGDKLNVTTARINYTNGSVEKLDTKVVFALSSAYPEQLLDEKGLSKYAFIEDARVIRDDKTLENTRFGFILNENVEVAADVTGIDFLGLERIDNDHYFDWSTCIMYNGSLNEVAYLPNAYDVTESGVIFTNVEGYYGIYSLDGKVIAPAKYAGLEESYKGVYMFEDNKAFGFLKVENDSFTVVNSYAFDEYEIASIYDPLYVAYILEHEVNEEVVEVYVNSMTGQEFTPFEPAEDDTPLGSAGYCYALAESTTVYSVFYQRANGTVYARQFISSVNYALPVFAE